MLAYEFKYQNKGEIEVLDYYGKYDVVVCGGGTSGCAAAISCARTGAKTLLIERLGVLGGQMNVSGPPGFAYAHLFNAHYDQVIAGFAEETHNRLLKEGHALPHQTNELRAGYSFSYVDPDWWGLLMFQMMQENNVDLQLHSLVVDVVMQEDTLKGVIVENASGRQFIESKVVIDSTGEGFIGRMAGAPYDILPKDMLEPSTLSFTVDGVDWDAFLKFVHEHPEEVDMSTYDHDYKNWSKEKCTEEFLKTKTIEEMGSFMGFFSIREKALANGDWHPYSGMGFFLMPREGGKIQAHFQHSSQVDHVDLTDVRDITRCEVECRNQIIIAWRGIRGYLPGFENAYITRVCPEIRIRETGRVLGDYVITCEDIRENRRFKDVIGLNEFPGGSKHVATTSTLGPDPNATVSGPPQNGGTNDIPYRALVPQKVENLLIAGKAISAERAAHHRFLQQTIVTGQAAGVAAALCARDEKTPRELEEDVLELQTILRKQGAILDGKEYPAK